MSTIKCERVTLLQLARHHCRWPIAGDGAATEFCGARRLFGSYCSTHAILNVGRGTEAERAAHRVGKVLA